MNTSEVESLVANLSENLDDLESSLAPLLSKALSTSTSQLPLLDKAKIYVLATYAIESLLFSYLRLNGVDAKNHGVFNELSRVKAYFEKLKLAEFGPEKRTTTLDKKAATRFVKHGLAGNDQLDRRAKRRADQLDETSQWGSANRFAGTAKRIHTQDGARTVPVVRATDVDASDAIQKEPSPSDDINKADRKAARRQRRQQAALANQSPNPNHRASINVVESGSSASLKQQVTPAQGELTDTISSKSHKKKRKKEHGSHGN